MIRINLLPEEYRRAERTSPKIFAATLLGVILVCSSFGWFGFVYLGELGNLEVKSAAVAEDLANKQKQAGYFDALEKEKKEFEKRSKTITDISSSRVLWTSILDELVDVVNNDGDTERHLAWFKSLAVSPGDGKRTGPKITMPGAVQGDNLKRMADFHEDLEHAGFFANVATKSAPEGKVETTTKKIPKESVSFGLSWVFKPTKDWKVVDGTVRERKGD